MSGWCPSSSVCGMAVVCAAAVLPSAVVRLIPYSSHCSAGEYCCHVVHCSSPGVWCAGGGCVSVLFVWWGILCAPPLVVDGGRGHCRRAGCVLRWWVAWWVKGGCVAGLPRLVCGVPVCVLAFPLVVPPCGPLNGGGGVCDALSSDWVWHFALCRSPSHCLFPSYRSRSSSVLCCRVCWGWGSAVRGTVSCSPLLSLCSLSQHCWFSAVSL